MPTVSVNLDENQYVRVNTAFNPMVLQAPRDTVRITLSELKPSVDNVVYHTLGGQDNPLKFDSIDTNVWALSMSDRSSLIVSEIDPQRVSVFSSAGVEAYLDQYSGALGVIEQEHMKIHKGEAFTVSERLTIPNVGGTHEFLAIVPALVFPHFRSFTVTSDGGPNDVDFYEGSTISSPGTPVTPFNNNRNSSNIAELLVYDTPVLLTDGVSLEPILIPGTKQTGSFGSEASNEWILKQDEIYMIRITNNTTGAGTSNFTINLFFYE